MRDVARWTVSPSTPEGEDGVRIKVVPADGAKAGDVAELAATLAVLPMLRAVMSACLLVLDRLQKVRAT